MNLHVTQQQCSVGQSLHCNNNVGYIMLILERGTLKQLFGKKWHSTVAKQAVLCEKTRKSAETTKVLTDEGTVLQASQQTKKCPTSKTATAANA